LEIFNKLYDLLDPLSGLARLCGIGGLSIGFIFIIFKKIISKSLFVKFTKVQSYKIIRLIILCSFGLAFLGIITYGFIKSQEDTNLQYRQNDDTLKYQQLKLERKGISIIDSSKKKK
jgi:hypothetical protein